ncbi:threonine aldolase family protein [Alicyclobacillus sp. ALC3]|uniref:threonine aldolase family protein n=1 Tax=Alicyclobacillus sp. ALC3 TaxID=2796143 RepID=UPI002378B3DE|nr:aminotransferase class I/II-fold pyridoxal phosphate-dependent enzyme [Alicyclobacillus sp. ALC3]WDL98400.1 aminotransferase class I/II-fold pyridoxal phosphate-dependent enzyme [Alicyclobacillus sp. ALC3]
MPDENGLQRAYKQSRYQIAGHGRRTVQVLKDALADVSDESESDMYGKGKVIEAFEEKLARYLGKDTAVFFPSGTMAQQIALRIWCDETGVHRVAYHPLCHLEIHEEDGLKELHQIRPILLADANRLIELDDVVGMKDDVSCVLLELPQREIGGQLPEFATLEAISQYCRSHNIRLHLDGARLFEVLPYYNKTAAEVCRLFDSVYVSFYKGIGGVAGAILAGDSAFTSQARVWKRRHGGDLISLYPYILTANYYFDLRVSRMGHYYHKAKELSEMFNGCKRVSTLPHIPVSNMFHVHVDAPAEAVEQVLIRLCNETGVGFTGNLRATEEDKCSFEVSVGDAYDKIPPNTLAQAFTLLNSELAKGNESHA